MGTNFAPAPQAPHATPHPPGPAARPRKGYGWVWILLLAAAGAAAYRYYWQPAHAAGAKESAPAPAAPSKKGMGAVPVVTATVRRGDFGIYLTGLGSVTAYNTVTIRTRVDGELIRVAFQEGQLVHKGDLLAEIDPRPYQAQLVQAEGQLAQAQGQLARDQATLENARADQRRYNELAAQGVVSRQQSDTQTATVRQAEGAIKADEGVIKADEGAIQNIKLQLVYCRIVSELDGRIGLRLVDPGNIVHAADANGMATITQLQPIAVLFNVAQDYLPEIMKRWNAGQNLPVEAWDRDLKRRIATGKLLTIDNAIDPGTGTARLKAEFANQDNSLFPNQFVNARLLLDTRRGAVIAPAAAVQHSPDSSFVYVVKDDRTVEMRTVTPGPVQGDDAIVEKGLAPGEIVVVDGVDKLQQGTRVEARAADQGKSAPIPDGRGSENGLGHRSASQ
ncbi:MAG TPA: MdtA/MuxA family multidrug efflux RND transporter periplasmic adaptor subunit [Bryobacteraceae bacterium]|nr:MdtA/MuxA family multidrug efflux RND transporter periplasmic adaptor subunit [Bryobacteraceae bacterium]